MTHDTHARSAGASGGAAGLVTSKTSLSCAFQIPLGDRAQAERRVARLRRSVWAAGKLHALAERGKRPDQCWFVTLTYRKVDGWRADHVSKAVQSFRLWCKRLGVACRYTWVGELQSRGAMHYHLLAWLPRHLSMPKWDRGHARSGAWWPHGMTNTQRARAGVGYLMKYLSKLGELSVFPKGARLYGVGGLDQTGRAMRQWFNLPEWAKCLGGVGDFARRACGLVVRATGEVLSSPYRVQFVSGVLEVRRVGPVAERFFDGAYSSFPRGVACA